MKRYILFALIIVLCFSTIIYTNFYFFSPKNNDIIEKNKKIELFSKIFIEYNGNVTWIEYAKYWEDNPSLFEAVFNSERNLKTSLEYAKYWEDNHIFMETLFSTTDSVKLSIDYIRYIKANNYDGFSFFIKYPEIVKSKKYTSTLSLWKSNSSDFDFIYNKLFKNITNTLTYYNLKSYNNELIKTNLDIIRYNNITLSIINMNHLFVINKNMKNQILFLMDISDKEYAKTIQNNSLLLNTDWDNDNMNNYFEKYIMKTPYNVTNNRYLIKCCMDNYQDPLCWEIEKLNAFNKKYCYNLFCENNTVINFKNLILNISKNITENDLVYIFLGMHGAPGRIRFYDDVMSYSEIDTYVDNIKGKYVIIYLMACYSSLPESLDPLSEGPCPRIVISFLVDIFEYPWFYGRLTNIEKLDADNNGYISIKEQFIYENDIQFTRAEYDYRDEYHIFNQTNLGDVSVSYLIELLLHYNIPDNNYIEPTFDSQLKPTINWVKYSNPSEYRDIAYAVSLDNNYIYIVGCDEQRGSLYSQLRIEKRNVKDGNIVKTWTNHTGISESSFTNCIIVNNKLYVIGFDWVNEWCRWLVYMFDTNLTLLKSIIYNPKTLPNIPYGISSDGKFLYISGMEFGRYPAGYKVRLEKRTLENLTLISNFTTVNYGHSTSISINNVTNKLYLLEDQISVRWNINILDDTFKVLKITSFSAYCTPYSCDFDKNGCAYISGPYTILKLNELGDTVKRIQVKYFATKILCINNKIYSCGYELINGYLKTIIYTYDLNLNLISINTLSKDNVDSWFNIGNMSTDGEYLYVAGYEKTNRGDFSWIIYSLSLI